MKNTIVVVGSSNTDMIIKTSRIPKPGETVIGGQFTIAAGGKGANQAVGAARAGGNVVFIARVGDDMFGKQAVDGFIADGIDVRHIVTDREAPSGVALIFVDERGENSIAVASGANARLSPGDIDTAKDVIAAADILLMQLEIPIETVCAAAGIAHENGVRVILNPAPARELGDDLCSGISILTPNESEAELLTGVRVEDEKSAAQAADMLLAKGIGTVILTLGPRGVYVASPEYSGIVSGFSVTAEDTTAAGDIFNGALAAALAVETPLREAVRFANAAAALSVMKLGAQTSAPFRRDIEDFLEERM